MPRLLTLLTATLLTCLISFQTKAEVNPLDDNAMQSLRSAIRSVDEGNLDVGIAMLESLLALYPDNYTVRYELAYAHLLTKDYEKTIEIMMPLTEHPDANDQAFSVLGSCYDDLQLPDKAIEIYDLGLKRFPASGLLHLEKGITAYRQENYDQALEEFENAIEVAPGYAAGYYRAARLYSQTNTPLLAIIYAEAHILLSGNTKRNEDMSNLIVDILKEGITMEDGKVNVSLSGDILTKASDDSSPLVKMLLFLELSHALSAESIRNGWNLASATEMRRKALESFTGAMPPTNRMALQKLQLAAIDAGHWDAYNYYILGPAFPDDAEAWIDDPANEEKFNAFAKWVSDHPELHFTPSNTVSFRLLNSDK